MPKVTGIKMLKVLELRNSLLQSHQAVSTRDGYIPGGRVTIDLEAVDTLEEMEEEDVCKVHLMSGQTWLIMVGYYHVRSAWLVVKGFGEEKGCCDDE